MYILVLQLGTLQKITKRNEQTKRFMYEMKRFQVTCFLNYIIKLKIIQVKL